MWTQVFELITGDYLFDPQSGTKYGKDDDHIAQIIELLGPFPKDLWKQGRWSQEIFNKRGELRNIHRLRHWALPDVLREKYHYKDTKDMTPKEREERERKLAKEAADNDDAPDEETTPALEYQPSQVADFLLPMLELLPEKRANAGGMANHPWLNDTPGMEEVKLNSLVPGTRGEGIEGWSTEVKKAR